MNNIAYWYPKLLDMYVLTPRTKIIKTNSNLVSLLDGKTPDGYIEFIEDMKNAANDFGYPVFIRTGHTSGKHEFEKTCYVSSHEKLQSNIAHLVEFSVCASIMGLPVDTWAVREFIQLDSSFALPSGMPVNRERRFFINNGGVLCHHPYWPEDAIAKLVDQNKIPHWREKLELLNTIDDEELKWLIAESSRVSESFEDEWSLDWARDKHGMWFAIDMAQGHVSWHWPECNRNTP